MSRIQIHERKPFDLSALFARFIPWIRASVISAMKDTNDAGSCNFFKRFSIFSGETVEHARHEEWPSVNGTCQLRFDTDID
jgi:hypothetical protein